MTLKIMTAIWINTIKQFKNGEPYKLIVYCLILTKISHAF